MKQPANALIVHDGDGPQDAVQINDHVYMARAVSNSYLVTTPDGDVVINTGMPHQGAEIRARYARVSQNPIRAIVFTQSHADHIGGWQHFAGEGVELIAQRDYGLVREYFTGLASFMGGRTRRLWGGDLESFPEVEFPDPVPTVTFADTYSFELGGRRFELRATPGGETADSLVVWLPDERTVFTGNLTGPLFGHVPNLYTLRGDKIRSARAYIEAVDLVIGLGPELLITGHGEPIRRAAEIKQRLGQLRDATAYLREKTFEGMNAGIDLWTLMREITLPPELAIPQGHGKVPWIVRAIWEEYIGWFRYESTTELYPVPPSEVWSDLVDLAGGSPVLTERAAAHQRAGRPVEALHLIDMVLAKTPGDRAALQVRLDAHHTLLERSGRENFSEVRWLEAVIRETKDALS